jgi:hypothetical protein
MIDMTFSSHVFNYLDISQTIEIPQLGQNLL